MPEQSYCVSNRTSYTHTQYFSLQCSHSCYRFCFASSCSIRCIILMGCHKLFSGGLYFCMHVNSGDLFLCLSACTCSRSLLPCVCLCTFSRCFMVMWQLVLRVSFLFQFSVCLEQLSLFFLVMLFPAHYAEWFLGILLELSKADSIYNSPFQSLDISGTKSIFLTLFYEMAKSDWTF